MSLLACWLAASVVHADGAAAGGPAERLVPATLVEVPAHVNSVLVADTAAAELVRFSIVDGMAVEADRRYMSIGRNGVGKTRAWDRKTPLGIYFLTEELDATKLAAKYGEAAFVMDYPNAWDRYNGRTGDGIWLHGVDPGAPNRPRRDTDGCLALPNDELLRLATQVQLHETPIVVSRQIDWVPVARVQETRAALREELERWRTSVERGDLHQYLSLYADDFSARGMNKREWAAFKLGVHAASQPTDVGVEHVLLLGHPEVPNLYLSRFRLTLAASDRVITIRKRLYWRNDQGHWAIVAEDAG